MKLYLDSTAVDKKGLMAGAIPWGWLVALPFLAWGSFWFAPSIQGGYRESFQIIASAAPFTFGSATFLMTLLTFMNRWPSAKEFVAAGFGLIALLLGYATSLWLGLSTLKHVGSTGGLAGLFCVLVASAVGIVLYQLAFAVFMKLRVKRLHP